MGYIMSKTQNKHKNLFKNILTTSAIVAVGMAPIHSASATARNTGGDAIVAADGALTNLTGGGNIANNDTITYNGAHTLTINSSGVSYGAIDINGQNLTGKAITVSNSNTFGDITDGGGGTAATFNISAASKVIDLNSTDYSGVAKFDFAGNASTINIVTDNAIIPAIDNSGGVVAGTINVDADNATIGAIGTTRAVTLLHDKSGVGSTNTYAGVVKATNINTAAGKVDFAGAVTADTITTAAGEVDFADDVTGDVHLNHANAKVTFSGNTKTLTGKITTETGNTGTLNITDDTTVTGNIGSIDGNPLVSKGLNKVDVTGQKVLTLGGNVFSDSANLTTIELGNHANTELILGGDNSVIAANVKANTAGTAQVTVNAENVSINKITNGLRLLTINDGKSAQIDGASTFDAGGGGNHSSIVIGKGSTLTYTPNAIAMNNGATVEGGGADQGHIIIRDGRVMANIGEMGRNAKLNKVTLGMNGATAAAQTEEFGDADTPLGLTSAITASEVSLVSSPNSANGDSVVYLEFDSKFNSVDKITADSSSYLIIHGNDYTSVSNIGDPGENVNIKFNQNKTLTLDSGGGGGAAAKTLYSNFTAKTAGLGTLEVDEADTEIHGNIGSATAANNIGLFDVKANAQFGGNLYAPTKIGNAVTLDIIDDYSYLNNTIDGKTNPADGAIKISAKNVTINDVIGGTTALKSITLAANATATLNANASLHTTGIAFGNNSELTVNSGKTLTFAGGATIEGDGGARGKLILNGQTIGPAIGGGTPLAEIEVNEDTTFTGGINATTLTLGSDNASAILGAASDVTGIALKNADLSGTKITLNHDLDVGAGHVDAVGEINFNADKTLKLTNGNFNAQTVTATTNNHGTVNIKSTANRTIDGDFGDVNTANKTIKQLDLEFTGGAGLTYTLTGATSAGEVILTINNANDTLKIGNSNAQNPAVISSHIKTSANNNGIVLIDGHAAVIGKIGVNGGDNFAKIKMNSDNSKLYLSRNGGFSIHSPVEFNNTDSDVIVFGNSDLTVNKNITTGAASKGSILAYNVSESDALLNRKNGTDFLGSDPAAYSGTLTFDGEIGTNNTSLKLLEVGNGNVVFTDTAGTNNHVAIDKVNANNVTLNGDRTFRFLEMNAQKLTFSDNATIDAGSTFLGGSDKAFAGTTEFDAAAGGAITIKFGDGVNMNLRNALAGRTNGHDHKLEFQGTHDVYSELGTSTSKFGQLKVTNAGTVKFREDIHTADLNLNHADSIVELYGNLDGNLTVSTDGHGTLKLKGGDKSITKVGVDGGPHRLGSVIIDQDDGATTTVTDQFAIDNLEFQSDSILALNHATTNITNGVTVVGERAGTIKLASDVTLNGNIATAAGSGALKELNIAGTTLTVANGANLNTAIKGTGSVIFGGASDSGMTDIGSASGSLRSVTFNAGGTVAKLHEVYSDAITLNDNDVTFRTAKGAMTIAAGGHAKILDGGYISAKGAGAGQGTVTINGESTIGQAGATGAALAALNLNAPKGSVVTLGPNVKEIHATAIAHNNGTLDAETLTTNGAYTMTDATLNLKSTTDPKLVANGNLTLANNVVIDANYKPGTDTIDSTAGVLNFAGLTTMKVKYDPVGGAFVDGSTILKPAAGTDLTDLVAKTTLETNDAFSELGLKAENDLLKLTVVDKTSEVLEKIQISGDMQNALSKVFASSPDVKAEIGRTGANVAEAVERYTNTETTTMIDEGLNTTNNILTSMTSGRIAGSRGAITRSAIRAGAGTDSMGLGVAAGSPSERFGVWTEITGGKGLQGKRKDASGFSSSLFGAVVGVDTMASDNVMVGVAFGNMQNNVKYRHAKSGDKVKSSTWMFTGYGSYALSNDYFARANFVVASDSVNAKEKRLGGSGTSIAEAKYKAESFSIEGALGKSFGTLDGGTITPSAGLRAYYLSNINYDEKGAGVLNRSIKKDSKVSAAFVANLQYATDKQFGDYVLSPEVHVNLQYDLGGVKNKGQFKPVGSTNYQKFVGTKSTRFAGRMGGSLTSYVNNIEYGIGYDVDISDRYLGHEGSLKLKMKF